MASRFSGTPVSFFIYSSPFPSQEEEEQIGSPKSPVSVIPVSFFSSREQQIGTPFTPHNAPKIMNPNFSISADRFRFRVPYTTDDAVVLQNLIHTIHSVINRDKMKSNSSSLTTAQRLFNSLDLVQKKVTQQLERIKETPTFQMGVQKSALILLSILD
ncbi:uncharacterized protein LOC115983908 [Quercus lobata]|uniref:Uncharacterized protein n=1 Tax=Quercus lobata TaxID=97700 RepID=A0A7N2LI48_QUELO|nr:uncharacterized protein LOC115983908 [Quercus lobata]